MGVCNGEFFLQSLECLKLCSINQIIIFFIYKVYVIAILLHFYHNIKIYQKVRKSSVGLTDLSIPSLRIVTNVRILMVQIMYLCNETKH